MTEDVRWNLTWEAHNSSHSGERRSHARTSLTCARDSIPGGQTWVQNCTRRMSWIQKESTRRGQGNPTDAAVVYIATAWIRKYVATEPQCLYKGHNSFNLHVMYLSSQSNWRFLGVPEILHALSQPLQQELDVLCDVLIIILLLFKVLQLFQHLALNHGQSVLLPGLPLCCLFQEILGQMTRREEEKINLYVSNWIISRDILWIYACVKWER